jgi:hypothetical protein
MSNVTAELLLKHGFTYEHNQSCRDFVTFYRQVGYRRDKIDYSTSAAEWMHPLERGRADRPRRHRRHPYIDDLPPTSL